MAEETRKKTYEAMPEVPEELRARYATILEVLSGKVTVSEGARRLKLSRNHFQTVLHRGLRGLLEGLTPGEPGRRPKPEREAELEREVERLQRAKAKLEERVETVDRLLDATSGYLRGEVKVTRDPPLPRVPVKKAGGDEGEGGSGGSEESGPGGNGGSGMTPGPSPQGASAEIVASSTRGRPMPGEVTRPAQGSGDLGASKIVIQNSGTEANTLGEALGAVSSEDGIGVEKGLGGGPGVSRAPALDARSRVAALVRESRGLIGAEALRRAVGGISRRKAAAVKRETLTEMERERKSRVTRVRVAVPGVIRGFDAMHVATLEGVRWSLVAADASIPYRTSVHVVRKYDGPEVARALDEDFTQNGAPLVARLDRWKAHGVEEVEAVLQAHGVLVLHGPPHHPGYYGQIERQNRDHRAWIDQLGLVGVERLHREWIEMLRVLNSLWLRSSLRWQTAQAVWQRRPRITVDREELREEVQDRAARIRRQAHVRGATADMAQRLAIESALQKRGLLTLELGGWC